jgi:AraC family transcriptional regulator
VAAAYKSPWQEYHGRLERVIDYIHDHLDEPLDLHRLAEVACLSPHHWHRIYHGMLGETAAETVRRLRLHRAAAQILRGDEPLAAIARNSGFGSVQSFSRVFRGAFGISPGEYRSRGSIPTCSEIQTKEALQSMYEVTIKNIPAMHALTKAHTGAYLEIGRAFDQLFGWLGAHNAIRPGTRMIALYYDDPAAVPEEQLRSRAGVILPPDFSIESPFDPVNIAGGAYAVLRHKGPYSELARAYQWLYGQWLPQSGREAAHEPAFEEYLNTPRDTAPPDLLTDIYLPLRP